VAAPRGTSVTAGACRLSIGRTYFQAPIRLKGRLIALMAEPIFGTIFGQRPSDNSRLPVLEQTPTNFGIRPSAVSSGASVKFDRFNSVQKMRGSSSCFAVDSG